MKNSDYLNVLYQVIDEEFGENPQDEIEKMKTIIEKLIAVEKEYDFSDERLKITKILDNLIRG